MRIIHILKDGTRLDDITGHVVRMEYAEPVYNLIRKINNTAEKSKVHKSSGHAAGSKTA